MTSRMTRLIGSLIVPAIVLGVALAGCESDEPENTEYDNPRTEPLCEAMIAAGCEGSPSSVESCQADFAGAMLRCPEEVGALIDCAGTDPSVACHPAGLPVFDECMAETIEAFTCVDG